jgi:DHA1 family multidrug resistance protein-like MFS transporter
MTAGAGEARPRGFDALRGLSRSLALLAAMAFVVQIGVAVMLPLLPLYATRVGATPFMLGLLTSGHAVASAVGLVVGGFLTERLPARRLVAAGIGLYAGANILIATTTAAVPLIAFRSLAGLGGGVNSIAERLYLTEATDRTRRAFANGLLSAAGAAGSVMGPVIGGLLVAVSDLRLPFLLVGATSALATLGALFLPRPRAQAEPDDDPSGTGAATGGPVDPPVDHGRRPIAALFFSNLALEIGFGAFITTYAIFATDHLGWSVPEVGIVWAMFGLGSIILGPWLARRADLGGRRRMAILGSIPVVFLPVVMVLGLPRPVIYAATVIAGGGLTAYESSWYALLAGATDEGRRGRTFGIIAALSSLGVAVGAMGAARAWELVDIRVALALCSVGFALAGIAMLAHPPDRVPSPAPATA